MRTGRMGNAQADLSLHLALNVRLYKNPSFFLRTAKTQIRLVNAQSDQSLHCELNVRLRTQASSCGRRKLRSDWVMLRLI